MSLARRSVLYGFMTLISSEAKVVKKTKVEKAELGLNVFRIRKNQCVPILAQMLKSQG